MVAGPIAVIAGSTTALAVLWSASSRCGRRRRSITWPPNPVVIGLGSMIGAYVYGR